MSSSSSSQRSALPFLRSLTPASWRGVAFARRGNLSTGSNTSIPDARTRVTLRPSVDTDFAAVSLFLSIVVIVFLNKEGLVFFDDFADPFQVLDREFPFDRFLDRTEPELRLIITLFDMNVRRLGPLLAIEE